MSTGIEPMLTSNNLPLKTRCQDVFLRWTDQCDFEGLRDFYGFQADLLRNVLIDGEALCAARRHGPGRGAARIEAARPRVSGSLARDRRQNPGWHRVRRDGPPRGLLALSASSGFVREFQAVRVPAANVLHIFQPPAPGVPRGVSWLARARPRCTNCRAFMEAELVRSRTASLFAGFVRTADGTNPLADAGRPVGAGTGQRYPTGAGRRNQLFSTPPESRYFAPYVQTQLRAISSRA